MAGVMEALPDVLVLKIIQIILNNDTIKPQSLTFAGILRSVYALASTSHRYRTLLQGKQTCTRRVLRAALHCQNAYYVVIVQQAC